MKSYLQIQVEKLAVSGLRNAAGARWEEAMLLMQEMIESTGHTPDVFSWKDLNEKSYKNFSVVFPGQSPKKIILGAHYDTYENTPGADDNASAVAVLLGILKNFTPNYSGSYTIEIVFYACEEPPFFGGAGMGSNMHAGLQKRDQIEIMICLEMVGFYSKNPHTQDYPFGFFRWIYGDKGDFIMGVSNGRSAIKAYKYLQKLQGKRAGFYRKLIFPFTIGGIDWSDHRNYWSRKIPAIMLTDTAMFRNKNYHTEKDVSDTLNYEEMEKLVFDLTDLIQS